jgi:CRP/FNR family transcriptional regulator
VVRPAALELFKGISNEDARRISGLCTERRYPQGATIFSEGDPSDAVFIVVEGVVEVVAVSKRGTETILYFFKPGQIFGELLLFEERRAFNAIAATNVLVTIIPRKSFEDMLRGLPAVAQNFIRLLSKRLLRVEQELAGFGHTWSYHRLGRVLLELGKEHGVKTPGGTLIPLRLTHADLAKLIGTTRETATTQINRFKRMGLLKREGGHLIVATALLAKFLSPGEAPAEHLAIR